MTKPQKRSLVVFVSFSVAGFGLAVGVAPSLAGFDQTLVLATGMTLFGSGLTTFLLQGLGTR